MVKKGPYNAIPISLPKKFSNIFFIFIFEQQMSIYILLFVLQSMFIEPVFLVPGGTRQSSCGGGCPNKDVPEETQSPPVLSVQRHPCVRQHCDK